MAILNNPRQPMNPSPYQRFPPRPPVRPPANTSPFFPSRFPQKPAKKPTKDNTQKILVIVAAIIFVLLIALVIYIIAKSGNNGSDTGNNGNNGGSHNASVVCNDGETRECGSDVGECRKGTESCVGGEWTGVCEGEVAPTQEICDGLDNNCDGNIDEGNVCGDNGSGNGNGGTQNECVLNNGTCRSSCYSDETETGFVCDSFSDSCCVHNVENPTCQDGEKRECGSSIGECKKGNETCVNGTWSGQCVGAVNPVNETCDGKDNDCNGLADEGGICGNQNQIQFCSDSDGGLTYNVHGHTEANFTNISGYYHVQNYDYCYSSIKLAEMYCNVTIPAIKLYDCPNGCDYNKGVCSSSQEQVIDFGDILCQDSDGGKNYFVYGETFGVAYYSDNSSGIVSYYDYCYNSSYIAERYCVSDKNATSVDIHSCAYGCNNGVCVQYLIKTPGPNGCGDLNKDGKVDQSDLDKLNQYVSGGLTGANMSVADLNGDRVLDMSDVTVMINYIGRNSSVPSCKASGIRSVCGDGACNGNETPSSCSQDCKGCGDRICGEEETCSNCPGDCLTIPGSYCVDSGYVCGDGQCLSGSGTRWVNGVGIPYTFGENSTNCPQDCPKCGDGICHLTQEISWCQTDCEPYLTSKAKTNGTLLAYYKFDEATGSVAYDSAGNYNGVLSGPYTRVSGKYGGAYNFNNGGHVHVSPSLTFKDNQFTFEAWVKPSVLDWTQTLLDGGGILIRFNGYADDCLHVIGSGIDLSSMSCGKYWLDGNWHHVAVTYDGADYRIYVDGIQEAKKYVPGIIFPTNFSMDIGTQVLGPYAYYFKGAIDDVKFWDYAKKSFDGTIPYQPPVSPQLVVYYKFDEGSGNLAKDSSGNGFDATIQESPEWVDGKTGKALRFANWNKANYVEIPAQSERKFKNENFTLQASIKLERDPIVGGLWPIIQKNGEYFLRFDSFSGKTYLACILYSTGVDVNYALVDDPNFYWQTGRWYDVKCTYNGNEIKFYVDGVLKKTQSFIAKNNGWNLAPTNIQVGGFKSVDNTYRKFPGSIDEFKIYNYVI